MMNQTPLMQANGEGFSSSNMTNFNYPNPQETTLTNNNAFVSQPNYVHCVSNPTGPLLSETSNFQSLDGSSLQNLGFDSVRSTPISSPTPLNSSSTFINGSSSTDDERESFSSLLKFEIPESLDINDFIM
ncbi:hypothetical protein COLO4_07477 [Corchorus olitorius]|uniref:Uncharacterized protein n=1 Tax=Corchorus olitorius TaxID=93759 RepID=A0A1R3KJW2_9ROSI|nr:hypothetical protein COLO4_07477 [Corchorus olitorius]